MIARLKPEIYRMEYGKRSSVDKRKKVLSVVVSYFTPLGEEYRRKYEFGLKTKMIELDLLIPRSIEVSYSDSK
mgnify:FL=1